MSSRIHVITLVVLAACSPTRRRTPDDTIVMVIETPMTTADPRYALTNYDGKLGKLIAPGLMSVDTPDAMPVPELAQRIDHVDDHTIDVTIRPGAVFSDGSPVTADDVARTYQTTMDAKCGSLYRANMLERFTGVEAVAPDRVRFHLIEPLAMFITDIEYGIVSFHGVPPGQCDPPRVIGAGPYVLHELTSTHVLLDANPRYPRPPKLPHVEIMFVADRAAEILMLVGGSADLLQNVVRPDLVDEVAQRPRVKVQTAPSVILTYMLINNDDPTLKDVRVRQALAYAIDRKRLVAAKLGGRAVLATGILPPSHWAYSGDVATYPYDPAKARALLDEAGLEPDAHGIRFHLVYKTSADAFRLSLARVIAAQLRDVGIDVEVRSFEFATFFTDIKAGNYQIATMQSPEVTEPDFHYWFFHSSRIPTPKIPNNSNRWHYRNPDFDRLAEAGRHELDPAKRKTIYAEAQRVIARDLPIIPLWHEDNVVLSNVDVQGYTIVPNARFIGLIGVTKSH